MKIIINLIYIILTPIMLSSQTSFDTIVGDKFDQQLNGLIVTSNGEYILAGSYFSQVSDTANQYVLKLNQNGDVINELIIETKDKACLFNSLHEINDKLYLIGGCKYSDPTNGKLSMVVLSENLEIEQNYEFKIPDDKFILYSNSIVDSDGNIVVTGYIKELEPIYTNKSFFYKISTNGDSLNSNFTASEQVLNHSFDLLESTETNTYYSFVKYFSDSISRGILTLNHDLSVVSLEEIPHYIGKTVSPIRIDEATILIAGLSFEYYDALCVLTMDTSFNTINYAHFKQPQYDEFPAFYNTTSKNGENIYIAGTTNFQMSYYGTQDSWFHLIKLNPDLTPIWEKWYGHHYHMLHNILATNDGGCIMVGTSYDSETQSEEKDIYIVKVDSNGLITWEKEIPVPQSTTTVYPNPGKEKLILKTIVLAANFQLTDLQGKVILQQNIQDNITEINTQTLSSGTYLWTLRKEGRIVESGKWVKN